MKYKIILAPLEAEALPSDVNPHELTDPLLGALCLMGAGHQAIILVILVGDRAEHNKYIGGHITLHKDYVESPEHLVRYGGPVAEYIHSLERNLLDQLITKLDKGS